MDKINRRKVFTFIFMTLAFTAYFQYDKHFGAKIPQSSVSTKDLELDPYYAELMQGCKKSSCCENSVKVMVRYDYKLADGNCEFGENMLRCIDSLKWCNPKPQADEELVGQ